MAGQGKFLLPSGRIFETYQDNRDLKYKGSR
jgi:hypothetical protein